MDNQIAATILQQIGEKRFVVMTGSHDFINLGNGLRMSLSRNKTSANRLVIDLLVALHAKKSSMTQVQTSTICGSTANRSAERHLRSKSRTSKPMKVSIAICLRTSFRM